MNRTSAGSMEPFAHANDLDDMADKLSQLSTSSQPYDDRPRIPSIPRSDSPRTFFDDFIPRPGTAKSQAGSERRPSRGSTLGLSIFPAPKGPAPNRPLPAVPPLNRANSHRTSLQQSIDGSEAGVSGDTSHYSQSSAASTLERTSTNGSGSAASPLSPPPLSPLKLSELRKKLYQPLQPPIADSGVTLHHWKQLTSTDKPSKDPTIYFFDVSVTSATLASKHGNNLVKVWSVSTGEVLSSLKISCYTTAQRRSREYFVRSHAVLSEPQSLIAIATGFGDTLEIYDWSRKKRLQTIDAANRWAAARSSNSLDTTWCPLATYRSDTHTIDLYTVARTSALSKKPLKKARSIDLTKCNLPILPKFPELAFSSTSPLLVTASGPRPPRPGHPPPQNETLLVAWEIHDGAPANTPYKLVTPWQHPEIETALPSGLATYGSVAVSIWIPASYKAVPIPGGQGGFHIQPVQVPYRYVLVWDFSVNSTRTFRIPNAQAACISPDCRFIAYCDASGVESGARGCLALLDAMSGKMLWCWPDPDAPVGGQEDLERELGGSLRAVSEMAFSEDGGFLFVGEDRGGIHVFEVRERDKVKGVQGLGQGEWEKAAGSGVSVVPVPSA